MFTRRIAAMVVAASVVGGIAVGAAASVMTSERSSQTAVPSPSSTPTPQKTGVEVKNAVLVHNEDGGATLSATVVNHTDGALDINSVTGGQEDAMDAPAMLVYVDRDATWLKPSQKMTVGVAGTGYLIQFRTRVQVGSILPITLTFTAHSVPAIDPITVTFQTPVVERGTKYFGVADSDSNPAIRVHDPMIVVIPGQEKAYVGGYITSTIQDTSFELPTAVSAAGETVQYRHQTATGGPFGVFAVPGTKSYFRPLPASAPEQSRFIDDGLPGSADYFRASDVTVGEKISVTMRFPSGDVVTKFKVVQGNADGTIAS